MTTIMMNHCGGCPTISPLICTSETNITTQLFIIALRMNYGTNIRAVQFSSKSIFYCLLSVKGTQQTPRIGLLSICILKVNHLVTLCFPKTYFNHASYLCTEMVLHAERGNTWVWLITETKKIIRKSDGFTVKPYFPQILIIVLKYNSPIDELAREHSKLCRDHGYKGNWK